MAGDDSAVTEPKTERPEGSEEKPQDNKGTSEQAEDRRGHRQSENEGRQHTERGSAPALPPRPLPPPHREVRKSQIQQHPPAIPFAPPVPYSPYPPVPVQFERPFSPRWHKTKLALGSLSIVTAAVIFGIGITLGWHFARFASGESSRVNVEFGVSGTAAGLAALTIGMDFLKIALSKRRQGMHPAALVTFHLIIWLVAIMAVVATSLYMTYGIDLDDYRYYDSSSREYVYRASITPSQLAVYEQVLLAFDCLLLLTHFVLFVGFCVETNHLEKARKQAKLSAIYLGVGAQAGAPYPGSPYPLYGMAQPLGPQLGAQGAQYPPTMMPQMPPQMARMSGSVPPQQGVLYGGYYAPIPLTAAGVPPQHQRPNSVAPLEYYAPPVAPAPPSTGVASPQQQPSAPAAPREYYAPPTAPADAGRGRVDA